MTERALSSTQLGSSVFNAASSAVIQISTTISLTQNAQFKRQYEKALSNIERQSVVSVVRHVLIYESIYFLSYLQDVMQDVMQDVKKIKKKLHFVICI